MLKHIKSLHFNERYQSAICDYQAKFKRYLSGHVKNVHQKSENVICNECNKSIQKKYLTRHMKIFHSGKQPQYNCDVCTFQSIHPYSLKNHVKNIHQKVFIP